MVRIPHYCGGALLAFGVFLVRFWYELPESSTRNLLSRSPDAPSLQPTTTAVQGYPTYKKTHHPRTLPQAYALGPRVVVGGWVFSYEQGTPVGVRIEG